MVTVIVVMMIMNRKVYIVAREQVDSYVDEIQTIIITRIHMGNLRSYRPLHLQRNVTTKPTVRTDGKKALFVILHGRARERQREPTTRDGNRSNR